MWIGILLPVILWVIFSGGMIYGSMLWLLCLADGEKRLWLPGKKRNVLGSLSFGNAIIITVICGRGELLEPLAGGDRYLQLGAEGILLSLLAGGLLAAACMDGENCYVYNYVWWWCLLWTGILLGVSCGGATVTGSWERTVLTGIRQAAAVAVFVLLQQFLFARMYGRADSHAFSVCALISCRWRGEMLWFLIHMLLAVTLLALVQLGKGNVTCRGKLRTPKPFIPYIVITFWGEILWMLCSQGA